MMSRVKGIAALLTSLAVTACTVFPAPEAPRVMSLGTVEQVERLTPRRPQSLRVDTPLASEPLNGTRILTSPSPHEIQTYSLARWRDSAPVLIRDHLIDTLRQSEGLTNVVTDTSPASTDLTLISELSAFHAEQRNGKTEVIIELHTEVLDNRSRKSLCVRDRRLSQAADSGELDDVVRSFGAAANRLSKETVIWVYNCLTDD